MIRIPPEKLAHLIYRNEDAVKPALEDVVNHSLKALAPLSGHFRFQPFVFIKRLQNASRVSLRFRSFQGAVQIIERVAWQSPGLPLIVEMISRREVVAF